MNDSPVPLVVDNLLKPIVYSTFCVECEPGMSENRAAYIYQGNSLCVEHFEEAKQSTLVKEMKQ